MTERLYFEQDFILTSYLSLYLQLLGGDHRESGKDGLQHQDRLPESYSPSRLVTLSITTTSKLYSSFYSVF